MLSAKAVFYCNGESGTYDDIGNLTSTQDQTGAGSKVTYAYRPTNLLDSVFDPGGSCTPGGEVKCTKFLYDIGGNRTKTTYPNGVTLNNVYDNTGRLLSITDKAPTGTTLKSFTYHYVIGARDTALGKDVTDETGATTTYAYDALNRLTQASNPSDTFGYSYDPDGNICKQVHNTATAAFGYDPANEMKWQTGSDQGVNCGPGAPAGAKSYTYDPAGQLRTSSAGLNMVYNARNQTTSITPEGGSATTLNYLGPNQNGLTGDGGTALQNNRLGLVATTTSGSRTAYTRDNRGTLVDGRPTTGSTYYYLYDGLGSVVGLTDASGVLVRTYRYDPYGTTTSAGSGQVDPFRFAGGYQLSTGHLPLRGKILRGRLRQLVAAGSP